MEKPVAILITIIVVAAAAIGAVVIFGPHGSSGPSDEYTVTFQVDHGTPSHTSIKVKDGTSWTQPSAYNSVLTFTDGQSVMVSPDEGCKFSYWGEKQGTVHGTMTLKAVCEGKVHDDCTVSFTKQGSGQVASDITVNKGVSFTSKNNVMTFSDGKKVTATPDEGFVFSSFIPASGTVTGDMSVTVVFKGKSSDYTVTISAGEGGSVSKKAVTAAAGVTWTSSGTKLSFSNGQEVTAQPDSSHTMGAWSPASGTVDSDLTITVSFNGGTGSTVSFYFLDNFDNDGFVSKDMYKTDAEPIITGIWSKGTGTDMAEAMKDAYKGIGDNVTIADGKITEMNGAKDGNIYLWAWDGSNWICKNGSGSYLTFNDLDITKYSYVAVVHGANDKNNGDAPLVNTTPNSIQWYYGDKIAPGSGKEVKFYICNQFNYTEFVSERTDASDYKNLIVQGLWIRGYADKGSYVMDALMNALDRIGYVYNISPGFINSINDCTGGNFLQAEWDNAAGQYYQNTFEHYYSIDLVDDIDYAGLSYGSWGGGSTDPPWPDQGATDCDWAY